MTTFAVVGSSTQSYPAERGTVHIAVSLEGAQREKVVRDSIEIHNRIAAAAKVHQEHGAATWWSANRVFATAFKEYVKNSDTTVVKYRSRSSIEVKFRDFTALSEWVSTLAEMKGVAVMGIKWALTQAHRTEVEKTARIAAMKDAVTKAVDYAHALGLTTPIIEAIYEPGLRPHVSISTPSQHLGASARGTEGASAMNHVLELKPNDIDVSANISADFRAS